MYASLLSVDSLLIPLLARRSSLLVFAGASSMSVHRGLNMSSWDSKQDSPKSL